MTADAVLHSSRQINLYQSLALGAAASRIGCNFIAIAMLPLIFSFRIRKAYRYLEHHALQGCVLQRARSLTHASLQHTHLQHGS